jgi:hypothetical protein
MMKTLVALAAGVLLFLLTNGCGANDVAVPQSCTPEVNARLAALIKQGTRRDVDNVMVCGVTIRPSRPQRPGVHGGHQILALRAELPGLGTRLVQIAINDELDGIVTTPAQATVFAYGQAYFDNTGQFVAGIHDVHCATHRGANNGWVVVNGKKSPESCR